MYTTKKNIDVYVITKSLYTTNYKEKTSFKFVRLYLVMFMWIIWIFIDNC